MQTTYRFNSATEITVDLLEAIKAAFKGKAVSITIKDEAEGEFGETPLWQQQLGLKELENIDNGVADLKKWDFHLSNSR